MLWLGTIFLGILISNFNHWSYVISRSAEDLQARKSGEMGSFVVDDARKYPVRLASLCSMQTGILWSVDWKAISAHAQFYSNSLIERLGL